MSIGDVEFTTRDGFEKSLEIAEALKIQSVDCRPPVSAQEYVDNDEATVRVQRNYPQY